MASRAAVLCVDPDPASRAELVRALGEEFEVTEAGSDSDALEKAKAAFFPVICATQGLKGSSGITLLRELAGVSPRTERILIAGARTLFGLGKETVSGEICCVFKPYKPAALRDVVRRLAGLAATKD